MIPVTFGRKPFNIASSRGSVWHSMCGGGVVAKYVHLLVSLCVKPGKPVCGCMMAPDERHSIS